MRNNVAIYTGKIIQSGIADYTTASAVVKSLKEKDNNATYNVSGVSGDYKIVKYLN